MDIIIWIYYSKYCDWSHFDESRNTKWYNPNMQIDLSLVWLMEGWITVICPFIANGVIIYHL